MIMVIHVQRQIITDHPQIQVDGAKAAKDPKNKVVLLKHRKTLQAPWCVHPYMPHIYIYIYIYIP